jgi:hypothetical protein
VTNYDDALRDAYIGWRPCCRETCVRPAARSLGSEFLCEKHAGEILIPIQRKLTYADYGVNLDDEIGIGVFDSPAFYFPPQWVSLRCDLDSCGATWVDLLASFPPCPYCLSRVMRSRA